MQNITTSEQARALSILRVFYGSYKKSVDFYASQGKDKESALAWNQHRLEDCEFLASIINRIEAIEPETPNSDCPF